MIKLCYNIICWLYITLSKIGQPGTLTYCVWNLTQFCLGVIDMYPQRVHITPDCDYTHFTLPLAVVNLQRPWMSAKQRCLQVTSWWLKTSSSELDSTSKGLIAHGVTNIIIVSSSIPLRSDTSDLIHPLRMILQQLRDWLNISPNSDCSYEQHCIMFFFQVFSSIIICF